MNEKEVYFVRHGQSEYNVSDRVLSYDTPLTPLGLAQAKECAERCRTVDFEVIFTSPYQRATKTAEIINGKRKRPIVVSEQFYGYHYPEETIGLLKKDEPSHLEMMSCVDNRYKGGTPYPVLQARVAGALELIERRTEESVLVVAHGYFLYTVLNLIVFGRSASFREFERIYHSLPHSNAGVTRATYTSSQPEGKKWKVVTWNDDGHLRI